MIISLCALVGQSFAQNRYRSRTSGDWSTPSTWQVETLPVGSLIWSTAVTAPDFSNASTITLRAGHIITVSSNRTVDEVTLASGSELIVNDGISLTLNNGTGADLYNYSGSVIRLLGEGFLNGSGSLVLAGDVHVYSINSSGAVVTGGLQGNIRLAGITYKNTGTIYYSGTQKQFMGNGQVSTLNAIINNSAGVEINNTSATLMTLNNLTITNGEFLCSNDNLTVNGTVLVNGGTLRLTNTSSARTHTINNLTHQSGSVIITNVGSTASLTTRFNGLVNLQAGNITFSSGTSAAYLNIYGDISGIGYFTTSGNNAYIRFYGSGNFTKGFPLALNSSVRSLTIDRSGLILTIPYAISLTALSVSNGGIVLASNLNVNSTLNLATGTYLDFSNYTLQISNSYNSSLSGGQLISNTASTLNLANAGTVGVLNFPPATSLGTLILNRSASVSTSNGLTITNALTLTRGTYNNTAGLSLSSGSTITRTNNGSFIGNAPIGGPYNVVYTGTTLSSGQEAVGTVNNLTSNLSGTLTLADPLSIQGDLSVNSGTLTAGSNAITAGTLTNSGTFNAPSSTLTLSGNLSSTGTFNLGTGDLVLTGTANQSISTNNVNQFNDITLTKTAGTVSINSNQNLSGILTVSSGATFDADGVSNSAVFTLLSTGDAPGSDASIATLSGGASVTGNVSVQRSWGAADDVYRYISSSVSNAPISQLQDSGIPVTGPFTGSSFGQPECTGCTNDYYNLGWYKEDARFAPAYAIGSGYQIAPAQGNDNTEVLVAGRGYELYMWNGSSQDTWTSRGTANQGSIPLTVSYTFYNKPVEDGWNLVGNPYPSSIQWEDNTDLPGGWTINNVSPIVWVWDVALQDWKFYDASSNSGNLTGGLIAAGQGFWVQAIAGSPSLTVHENAKSQSSGQYYRTRNQDLAQLQVRVTNGTWESSAYLVKEGNVTDVPKFRKGVEGISIAFMNEEGSNFARLKMQDQEMFPISVVTKVEGEYTFSFTEEGNFTNFVLVDNYLQKTVPLSDYTFIVTKETSSFVDRFMISRAFTQSVDEKSSIVVYPNPVGNELTVEFGEEVRAIELLNSTGLRLVSKNQIELNQSIIKMNLAGLNQGMYFVRVVKSDGSTYLHKIIKR